MAIEFQYGELPTGDTGSVRFAGNVVGATARLTKFDLHYDDETRTAMRATPEDDHHVREINGHVSIVGVDGRDVTVRADGEISDGSGHHGGGTIGYLVVAHTE